MWSLNFIQFDCLIIIYMIHNVSHVCLAIIVRFLLSFPFFLLSFVFISFSLLVFWILHVVPFKSLTMKTSNNHPKVNIKMYTTYWWSFSNSTKKNVIRWDRMLIDKSLEELRIQTCDRSVNNNHTPLMSFQGTIGDSIS